jgi:hypothetical protein
MWFSWSGTSIAAGWVVSLAALHRKLRSMLSMGTALTTKETAVKATAKSTGALMPWCQPRAGPCAPEGHDRRVPVELPSSVCEVVRERPNDERPRTTASGGGGIRTHERVTPLHAFEACSFGRSDTPP